MGSESKEKSRLRIAVLYVALPGYMAACLRTLQDNFGVELLVFHDAPYEDAPFDDGATVSLRGLVQRNGMSRKSILEQIERFNPVAVCMVGWMDRDYLAIARQLKQRGVLVIAGCDRQWQGTLRQRAGQFVAPAYLHPAIDVLWVAGERQRQLAARLGYRGDDCWNGIYACDWERFASEDEPQQYENPAFLYVGRYVEAKGIEDLVAAYSTYRKTVSDPWPLRCVGAGPLAHVLEGIEGIHDLGFVQPVNLPAVMRDATVFLLPSVHEPWGVVVQEAAASGLVLLCSNACGAADHLLLPGTNGLRFPASDVSRLTAAMTDMASKSRAELRTMGRASMELSRQYTPKRWSETLIDGLNRREIRTTPAEHKAQ